MHLSYFFSVLLQEQNVAYMMNKFRDCDMPIKRSFNFYFLNPTTRDVFLRAACILSHQNRIDGFVVRMKNAEMLNESF